MVGVADGWFDDPIGLLARAYILVPPIALGKSLLARSYLTPRIELLPDPRAYASSPYWPLLHMTKPHSHTPLRHINVPVQHAYASSPDWLPQSRCCLFPGVIPFMILGHSHELGCLCSIYRFFVIRASYPTARIPSLFFPLAETSAKLRISPPAYSEDNNRRISQQPHFPISSSLDSRCTPQFCYLGNSSTLLILVVLRSS